MIPERIPEGRDQADLVAQSKGEIEIDKDKKNATLTAILGGRKIKIVTEYKNIDISVAKAREDFNTILAQIQSKGIEGLKEKDDLKSLTNVRQIDAQFYRRKTKEDDAFKGMKASASEVRSLKPEERSALEDSLERLEGEKKKQPGESLKPKSALKKGPSPTKHVRMAETDEVTLFYSDKKEVVKRTAGEKSERAEIDQDLPLPQKASKHGKRIIERGPTLSGQSIQEQFGPTRIPLKEITIETFKEMDVDFLYVTAEQNLIKSGAPVTPENLFKEMVKLNNREVEVSKDEIVDMMKGHTKVQTIIPSKYYEYPQLYKNEIAEAFSQRLGRSEGAPLEIKFVRDPNTRELRYRIIFQITTEDEIRQKIASHER